MLNVILSTTQIFDNIDRESFLKIKNKFIKKHQTDFEKFKKTKKEE